MVSESQVAQVFQSFGHLILDAFATTDSTKCPSSSIMALQPRGHVDMPYCIGGNGELFYVFPSFPRSHSLFKKYCHRSYQLHSCDTLMTETTLVMTFLNLSQKTFLRLALVSDFLSQNHNLSLFRHTARAISVFLLLHRLPMYFLIPLR